MSAVVDGAWDKLSRRHLVVTAAAGAAVAFWGRTALAQIGSSGLTAQGSKPFLNQGFLFSGSGVTTTLTLFRVTSLDRERRPAKFPDPFVLLFRARPGDTLPAGIYAVQDPAGHSTEMFVSPASSDPSIYQAVLG